MYWRKSTPKAEIIRLIKAGQITLGGNHGNAKTRVYGDLDKSKCSGGRSIAKTADGDPAKSNQVFFASEAEALRLGYRPCGTCRKDLHKERERDPEGWTRTRLALLER